MGKTIDKGRDPAKYVDLYKYSWESTEDKDDNLVKDIAKLSSKVAGIAEELEELGDKVSKITFERERIYITDYNTGKTYIGAVRVLDGLPILEYYEATGYEEN